MNDESVRQWTIKADHDIKIGLDEMATDDPAIDMICFHMQQAVEKYLKAFLVSKNIEITKTHNLGLVLQQCIEADGAFEVLRSQGVDELTVYAVEARYPDDFRMPAEDETKSAIMKAEATRAFVSAKVSNGTDTGSAPPFHEKRHDQS